MTKKIRAICFKNASGGYYYHCRHCNGPLWSESPEWIEKMFESKIQKTVNFLINIMKEIKEIRKND